GLKAGDIIVKIDDTAVTSLTKLSDALSSKMPGDSVTLTYRRDGKTQETKVVLGADASPGGRARGWDDRLPSYWKKDVYRLAVICVEYPDVKHNDKIGTKDWEEALFSRKTYVNKKSVTGQDVFGSLNDYYQEQSYGNIRVEGKVFDW